MTYEYFHSIFLAFPIFRRRLGAIRLFRWQSKLLLYLQKNLFGSSFKSMFCIYPLTVNSIIFTIIRESKCCQNNINIRVRILWLKMTSYFFHDFHSFLDGHISTKLKLLSNKLTTSIYMFWWRWWESNPCLSECTIPSTFIVWFDTKCRENQTKITHGW